MSKNNQNDVPNRHRRGDPQNLFVYSTSTTYAVWGKLRPFSRRKRFVNEYNRQIEINQKRVFFPAPGGVRARFWPDFGPIWGEKVVHLTPNYYSCFTFLSDFWKILENL